MNKVGENYYWYLKTIGSVGTESVDELLSHSRTSLQGNYQCTPQISVSEVISEVHASRAASQPFQQRNL